MARSALTAPAHTVLQRSPGQYNPTTSSVSPDAAPSLCYGGSGLLDHRMAYNKFNSLGFGSATGAGAACVGWNTDSEVVVLDATPVAAATANIAALANVVSGTPMALVSSSGGGVTVTTAPFTYMSSMLTAPVGSVFMGTTPGYLKIGSRDITAFYDPTTALTYVIQITGVASGTGGAFVIRGFDYYGFAMSEQITATAGATSVAGLKAWKSITSVTPQFTDAHNYSVGTTLRVGLHLAVDYAGYIFPYVNAAGYTANPAVTAADTTSPATLTTGDVRGTFVPTAVRTVLYVTPTAARLTQSPLATGLFGVPQFSN